MRPTSLLILSLLLSACASRPISLAIPPKPSPPLGPTVLEIFSSGPAMMEGSEVRLTCRVPRDARHRYLHIGIAGPYTRGSVIDLDGDQAVITHEKYFQPTVCGSYALTCAVFDGGVRELAHRQLRLEVKGSACHEDAEF